MTPFSWFYMLMVWAVILIVTGYCFWRLLKPNGGDGAGKL